MKIAFLVGIVLLTSCAHTAGSKGPPKSLGTNTAYYDTQVVASACLGRGEESGVVAALGAAAIAKGVSRIGDAIKAAGETETAYAFAQRNIEMSTSPTVPPCIFIARGWFYRDSVVYPDPEHGIAGSSFHQNAKSQFPYKSNYKELWYRGLLLAATPDFFFQGKIRKSVDGTAWTVMPVETTLDEPISTNVLRPGGSRSVLVALAFSKAGSATDIQKSPGTTIKIGAMKPGSLITYPKPSDDAITCSSAFVHTPSKTSGLPPKEEVKHGECPTAFNALMRTTLESSWFILDKSERPAPMLLQAMVSETRSPSAFLKFVGEVFGESSKTVTEELQEALIPSVGKTAELADLTADEASKKAYDVALSKAYTDLSACIAAPTDPSKRIAARISIRDLIAASRSAGVAVSGFDPGSIATTGTTADECRAQRALIQ